MKRKAPKPPSVNARMLRLARIAAVVAVAVFGILLSVRSPVGEDLGCHLAYGQQFWADGRIVDYNDFLYTLPAADATDRPEPMAGAWYDDQGRLRFPNANWLTQVVFAGAYSLGGFGALNILLMLSVWALLAGVFVLLRRLGAGAIASAAGVVLVALIAYERFSLRPELLGYLALLGQAILLAPVARDVRARPLRWSTVIAIIALQCILTNVHSYFYIGWGLTVAVCLVAVARMLWQKRSTGADIPDDALAGNVKRLGVLTGLQLAAPFLNPWTWRLVVLPAQTARYISAHGISAPHSGHPWSYLHETNRTFARFSDVGAAWDSFAAYGFHGDPILAMLTVAIALAAVGALIACLRRRWSLLLWMVAGVYLSLSMIRNMGVGVLLMVPAAIAVMQPKARASDDRPSPGVTIAGAAVLIVLCSVLSVCTITNRLYPPRSQAAFGLKSSRTLLPTHLAEWLNEHPRRGRLLTDFTTSSNLYFLLDPRPEMPIITNGWAYPPQVMTDVRRAYQEPTTLTSLAEKHGISTVVVRADRHGDALMYLLASPDWSLVFMGGAHVVFMRLDGPDGVLAGSASITAEWDAAAFVAGAKAEEPWPGEAMYPTARILLLVGRPYSDDLADPRRRQAKLAWINKAVVVLSEVVRSQSNHAHGWYDLAIAHANRATLRRAAGDESWRADVQAAREACQEVLGLHPTATVTPAKLAQLQADARNVLAKLHSDFAQTSVVLPREVAP